MGLPKRKSTTPISDPDVITVDPDPDVISLAGQEDPDVIPLSAAPVKSSLTTPAQPVHTEASGDLQPRGQGPIPPLEYPHTPMAGAKALSQGPAPAAQKSAFSPNQQIEILPRLESTSPIPAPPMPAAPIPRGLQGPPSRTPQGEFPRFGPGQDLPTPGPLPGFQGVMPGIEKMGRSFSRMSYGTLGAATGSPRQTTSQAPNQIDPDAWRPPDLPAKIGAAADVVEGFEEASAPYIMPALAAGAVAGGIPVATAIGANMMFGLAGEELTRRGLESAGVDPRYAKAAGKVVGWGPVEKMPGYSHAIGGAAEALIPDSATKQFATGLGKSVDEFNTLVDDLAKMDPSSPEYSQALGQLKSGEAQLGVAANSLAQANLLGAIKSAQVMGKMRKVPAAETAAAGATSATKDYEILTIPGEYGPIAIAVAKSHKRTSAPESDMPWLRRQPGIDAKLAEAGYGFENIIGTADSGPAYNRATQEYLDNALSADVQVEEPWRRRGVATAMYNAIEQISGKPLQPSGLQSNDAKAFWANRLGQAPPEALPSPDIISLPAADAAAAGEPLYKSSTTQYNLPDDIAGQVRYLGESVPDSALAESGREADPHLTIRYGIEEDPQIAIPKIRQALANQPPITVRLGEASLFPDSGNGEVLKIDVDQSPELSQIRDAITQSGVSHRPDKGDELGYSPHITVAYLKPGEGQGFVGPNPLTGQELVIDRIWVGDRNGNQYEVPFGKSMEGILGPEQEAIRPILGESEYQEGPQEIPLDEPLGDYQPSPAYAEVRAALDAHIQAVDLQYESMLNYMRQKGLDEEAAKLEAKYKAWKNELALAEHGSPAESAEKLRKAVYNSPFESAHTTKAVVDSLRKWESEPLQESLPSQENLPTAGQPKYQIRDNTYLVRDDLQPKLMNTISKSRGNWPDRILPQDALNRLANAGLKKEELAWHQNGLIKELQARAKDSPNTPVTQEEIREWALADTPYVQERIRDQSPAADSEIQEIETRYTQKQAELARMRQEISTYTLASLPDELYDKYHKLDQEVVALQTMLARRRAPQDDTKFASYSTGGPDRFTRSYRERLFIAPDIPNPPRTHWQEPGVFLHTRESDRVGPDGQKIFFVDEVQSDWAQKGRSEGYATPETRQARKDAIAAAKTTAIEWIRNNLSDVERRIFDQTYRGLPETAHKSYITQMFLHKFGDRYDSMDVPEIDNYINFSGRTEPLVAPMPFPDSWAEMAIRRTLQAAAREGYQKFQWLGGVAQADRYSLRKVVDRLEYDPKEQHLSGFNSAVDLSQDLVGKTVSPEDLPNYVGKEIAERLLASPLQPYIDGESASRHVLKDTELEVGGKFHQTLYDVRIPSYVKKLTKQQPRKVEITDGKGEILEAWEIDITPEVQDKMSEAQPLFHVTQSGQAAAGQLWTPEQLSKSLPGYKMDVLPNDERTNPGGATLGLETPSGKWAKLIVTKGRDLPVSPESMAKQLGRPALPGEVVMGQYESRGLREQSVITLAGAAGPETLDHELFHYAFDTFLTPQEQAAILATHGSEEAAAIAYGQGKGGLDPGLSRLKKLFTEIHNKFYPDSKATLERLRSGRIWERQARYGVDTREPVYRKPDGSLDWSLESMAKSFLETFDRNLVRFESNDPVFLAATLAAPGTSQSIAREALIGPAQEIARSMHAGGYGQGSLQQGWVAFAEVLIDNRLAGVQGRWNDLAGAVEKATQKQLRQALARHSDAPDGPLIRVLDRIDSDQPMANGNSRAGKVQAMMEAKDYAGAKAYLGALFRHNAYATKRLDLQGKYGKSLEEFSKDPQFKQALQIYKSKVEALFASHHLKNEGMLSADLGPLDTYYPLVPQETGDMPVWQQSARQRGYWIRPHNPSNYFTTGLATKGYDPELSTLRGRLTAAIRGGNVAQFLQVMRGTGLAVKVTDANAATAIFRGGEELPVTVIPLGSAQSISVKGQQLKVPPQYIAVPKALGPTCKSIVLGEGPGGSSAFHSEGFIEDAVNRITGWSLVGPADAAFHAQAVLSSLVAGTPYLRQSNAFLSVMANLPVTKAFTAMWEAYRKPAKWFTSPEGEKTLMAMAQGGMLNPRIGSVAWDKDYADLFGAEWKPPIWRKEAWRRTPEESAEAKAGGLGAKIASYLDVAGRIGDLGTSAVVFGHPGEGSSRWLGLDLRARVSLYELHLQLFPDAPLSDRANFVNQAMQYNWGLQSHLEQYIKGYAGTRFTSVFFTAGYSMIRAGVRAMNPVGTKHGLNRLDPIGQQQLARAQRAFSGGITGMVAGWALLNFASSGGKHWPWETDQEGGPVPLNTIALPDDIRQSPIGVALMGDPAKGAPKRGYMPMGFFNAAVKKGLDATGARAAYDTGKLLEGKTGQTNLGWTDPVGRQLIAMEAMRSSMNTFLHPLTSGPIPRAGMAALGMSPWIGPMWDPITGRNQFSLRSESRAAGSLFEATGAGLARAAGQMSPMANFLNEAGMESVLGSPLSGATKRDDGAAWAKTLADIMFPRSRPVGKDIPKLIERTRDLVTKRKGLIQRQRADAARAKK